MASTVDALFDAAGVVRLKAVPWRAHLPSDVPGMYVIARTADPAALVIGPGLIDEPSARQLLDTRPELPVDGERPSPEALARRLASMWLPDEPAVYVGMAGLIEDEAEPVLRQAPRRPITSCRGLARQMLDRFESDLGALRRMQRRQKGRARDAADVHGGYNFRSTIWAAALVPASDRQRSSAIRMPMR